MLNFETILNILNKYGYDSKTLHPFVYQNDQEIGICYSYTDQKYGLLERVALFNSELEAEDFIKKFQWYNTNGKNNNVVLTLSNYEDKNPKIIYKRNNRIMADDEMFNLEKYNQKLAAEKHVNETSGFLKVAEELLALYEIKKSKIDQYFAKANDLINNIKARYVYLQSLVDKYNLNEEGRNYDSETTTQFNHDISIDIENAAKDKFSQYKSNPPSELEINELIKDIAYLLRSVEVNEKYFALLPVVFDMEQEMTLLQLKIEKMENLINKKKNIFSYIYNIKRQFKKLEQRMRKENKKFDMISATTNRNQMIMKYDGLKVVSFLNYASYLNSAENYTANDFLTLANKFSSKEAIAVINPLPELTYEQALSELNNQYQKLPKEQQYALQILNSNYFSLIKEIIRIKDYNQLSGEQLVSLLEANNGFQTIKTDCYDNFRILLEDYNNILFRNTVFNNLDYTSFASLIKSVASLLNTIKTIAQKIPGTTKGYFETIKIDNIVQEGLVLINNDVGSLVSGVKPKENKIVITNLSNCSCYYSPQTLVIPKIDAIDKKISYNQSSNTQICIAINQLGINLEKEVTGVSRYYSVITKANDISVVSALNLAGKNNFVELEIKEA